MPLYLLDPVAKSVCRLSIGEVAWPVAFILSLHRKHVLRIGRTPSPAQFGSAVRSFLDKIRWHIHLSGRQGDHDPAWRSLLSKRTFVRPCPFVLGETDEHALHQVAVGLVEEGCRARVSLRRRPPPTPAPIYVMALKMLRESHYAAVPTDKDGGFCLVHKESLFELHRQNRAVRQLRGV